MPLVFGTAGHIDHGKSSLVRWLSGIDPDRLKEEKERGITIELGFAHLDLPSFGRVSIVDVPGHERFVRHMVAGAQGIDAVILVVAADEGVMPQTREHLDICRLLGVKRGLIALTKSDLVDEEFLALAIDDVRSSIENTFLDGAPILPVSSIKETGKEMLLNALDKMASELPARFTDGVARLPVDRVFTLKGFGSVVTGTMLGGRFESGDFVEIHTLSARGLLAQNAKIRSLQVHSDSVDEVFAGQRAALCLSGIERQDLERGATISTQNVLQATRQIDGRLFYLGHNRKSLLHRTSALFHLGTTQAQAQILLFEGEELLPGQEALIRLRLDRPIVGLPGERFILRGFQDLAGHGRTIGGGEVLDLHPLAIRKRAKQLESLLPIANAREENSYENLLLAHLQRAKEAGMSLSELVGATGLAPFRVEKFLGLLGAKQKLRRFDVEGQRYVSQEAAKELSEILCKETEAYHKKFPMRPGIPREELRTRLGESVPIKLFHKVLTDLGKQKLLEAKEDVVRMTGFQARAGDAQKVAQTLEKVYQDAQRKPPRVTELEEILSKHGIRSDRATILETLNLLRTQKILYKVSEELYFDEKTLKTLQQQLLLFLQEKQRITTQEWKEMVGASRKYTIPLAEYFDQQKITLRVGDERKLRPQAIEKFLKPS